MNQIMVNWKCSNFDELNIDELYAIIRLRSEVFVVEQNCPYQDMDDLDKSVFISWVIPQKEI